MRSERGIPTFRGMEAPGAPENELGTRKLVTLATEQFRLLARAELLHAKLELKEDLAKGMIGIGFGVATIMFVSAGIAALFIAASFFIPIVLWGCALIAAGVLFAIGAMCALISWFRLPKDPLHRTRSRLSEDMEELQEHVRH